jgi:hypothetical protein
VDEVQTFDDTEDEGEGVEEEEDRLTEVGV